MSEWLVWDRAVDEIADRLNLRHGLALGHLYELCDRGEVQAFEFDGTEVRDWHSHSEDPRRAARPPLALTEEVDPSGSRRWVIVVKEDDLLRWLNGQLKKGQTGKQPRILRLLAGMFPGLVPDPSLHPRKILKADLIEADPSLAPLDEATLKAAIEKHNAKQSDRPVSD
jgi:hypothetical protein